jgi:uncharacterized membrane protein YuzA (DUF378 family)
MNNLIYLLALIFTIIGALNWLLVADFNFNLVEKLFKSGSLLTKIIYNLVGISAIIVLVYLFSNNFNM